MDKRERIERFRRDLLLTLPEIIISAKESPYKVSNNGVSMGELKLTAATLIYIPNKNFSAYAEPIHKTLEEDDFKLKVNNLCRVLLNIKGDLKIKDKIIYMDYKTYAGFINSPNKESIIVTLRDIFDGHGIIRIIDDNSTKDIKI